MIVIIVNIISSLSIVLGGIIMIKYARSHADFTIGFRTKRSMSSEETWCFANRSCGFAWLIIGAVCFVLTLAALIIAPEAYIVQTAILIIHISAVAVAVIYTEMQLRRKFGTDANNKKL